MRIQYLSLACLFSIISGLAVTSRAEVPENYWVIIWSLFAVISGMILNLPKSPPSQTKVIRESIIVSGFFCLTIFGRNLHRAILEQLASKDDSLSWCISGCVEFSPFWLLVLVVFIFITSSIAISITTLSGKLLLQYTRSLFALDSKVFEQWKNVITGALSFVSFVFMTIKSLG